MTTDSVIFYMYISLIYTISCQMPMSLCKILCRLGTGQVQLIDRIGSWIGTLTSGSTKFRRMPTLYILLSIQWISEIAKSHGAE